MYRGGGILVVGSIALAVAGTWRLWVAGRRARVGAYLAAVAVYPLLGKMLLAIADDHLRLWLAIPFAVAAPIWIMIGFFVDADARKMLGNTVRARRPRERRRSIKGFFLMAISLLAWLYGAMHKDLANGTSLFILCVVLYGSVIGLTWVATGRKLTS